MAATDNNTDVAVAESYMDFYKLYITALKAEQYFDYKRVYWR